MFDQTVGKGRRRIRFSIHEGTLQGREEARTVQVEVPVQRWISHSPAPGAVTVGKWVTDYVKQNTRQTELVYDLVCGGRTITLESSDLAKKASGTRAEFLVAESKTLPGGAWLCGYDAQGGPIDIPFERLRDAIRAATKRRRQRVGEALGLVVFWTILVLGLASWANSGDPATLSGALELLGKSMLAMLATYVFLWATGSVVGFLLGGERRFLRDAHNTYETFIGLLGATSKVAESVDVQRAAQTEPQGGQRADNEHRQEPPLGDDEHPTERPKVRGKRGVVLIEIVAATLVWTVVMLLLANADQLQTVHQGVVAVGVVGFPCLLRFTVFRCGDNRWRTALQCLLGIVLTAAGGLALIALAQSGPTDGNLALAAAIAAVPLVAGLVILAMVVTLEAEAR